MHIQSVMMPVFSLTFDGSWSLKEVLAFFRSSGQDYVSIAKNDRFLGIVTAAQIRKFVAARGLSREQLAVTPVIAVLNPESGHCHPESTLRDVWHKMVDLGVKYLPVKRQGDVVGIVSYSAIDTVLANQ